MPWDEENKQATDFTDLENLGGATPNLSLTDVSQPEAPSLDLASLQKSITPPLSGPDAVPTAKPPLSSAEPQQQEVKAPSFAPPAGMFPSHWENAPGPAEVPKEQQAAMQSLDDRIRAKEFHDKKQAALAEPAPERSLPGEFAASVGRGALGFVSSTFYELPSFVLGDMMGMDSVKRFFQPFVQGVELDKASNLFRPGKLAGGPAIDLERIVANPNGAMAGAEEVTSQVAQNVTNAYFWAAQLPEQLSSLMSIAAFRGAFVKGASMVTKLGTELSAASRAAQADALWFKAAEMGITKPLQAAVESKNYAEVARIGTGLATNIAGQGAVAAEMGNAFAKTAELTHKMERLGKIGMYGGSIALESLEGIQRLDEYEAKGGVKLPWTTRMFASLGTGLVAGPMEAFSLDKIVGMFWGKAGGKFLRNVLEGMATEGITETFQTIAENFFEKYGYNPDQKILEGVAEAALVGAAMGGLGGGVGAAFHARHTQIQKTIQDQLHNAWLEEQQQGITPRPTRGWTPDWYSGLQQPDYSKGEGRMASYGPQQGAEATFGPQQGAEATYGPQLGAEPGFGPQDRIAREEVPGRTSPVSGLPDISERMAPTPGGGFVDKEYAARLEQEARQKELAQVENRMPMGSTSQNATLAAAADSRVPGGIIPGYQGSRAAKEAVPERQAPSGPIQENRTPAQQVVSEIRQQVLSQPVDGASFSQMRLTPNMIRTMAEEGASLDTIRQAAGNLSDYQSATDNTPALTMEEVTRLTDQNHGITMGDLFYVALDRINDQKQGAAPKPIEAYFMGPAYNGGPLVVRTEAGPLVPMQQPASQPASQPIGAGVSSVLNIPAERVTGLPPGVTPQQAQQLVGGMGAAPNVGPQLPPLGEVGQQVGYGPVAPESLQGSKPGFGPPATAQGAQPGFGPPAPPPGAEPGFGPPAGAQGAQPGYGPSAPAPGAEPGYGPPAGAQGAQPGYGPAVPPPGSEPGFGPPAGAQGAQPGYGPAAPPAEAPVDKEAQRQAVGDTFRKDGIFPYPQKVMESEADIYDYLRNDLAMEDDTADAISAELWRETLPAMPDNASEQTDNDILSIDNTIQKHYPGQQLDADYGITDFSWDLSSIIYDWYWGDTFQGRNPEPKKPAKEKSWAEGFKDGTFSDMVYNALDEKMDAVRGEGQVKPIRLQELVAQLKGSGFTQEEWHKHQKAADEAAELAIVNYARQIIRSMEGKTADQVQAELELLYGIQPTLASRTSTTMGNQAYSTPVTVAHALTTWLKAKLGGVTNGVVFEPTAGNGMLMLQTPVEDGWVNEKDKARIRQLVAQDFSLVTSWDAANMLEQPKFPFKKVSAIIANPPFGSLNQAVDFNGYKITKLDHLIALNSLEAMKDNGKAALILGGHSFFNMHNQPVADLTTPDMVFLNYLYKNYNVTHQINVSGQVYKKMGTSFPIRVLTIEGRRPNADGPFAPRSVDQIQQANTTAELLDLLVGKDFIHESIAARAATNAFGIKLKPADTDMAAAASEFLDLGDADVRGPSSGGRRPGQRPGGDVGISRPHDRPGGRARPGSQPGGSESVGGPTVGGGGARPPRPGSGGRRPGAPKPPVESGDKLDRGGPVGSGAIGRTSLDARTDYTRNVAGGGAGLETSDLIRLYAGELSIEPEQVREHRKAAADLIAQLPNIAKGFQLKQVQGTGAQEEVRAYFISWASSVRSTWFPDHEFLPFAEHILFADIDTLANGLFAEVSTEDTRFKYWQTILEDAIPQGILDEINRIKKEMIDSEGLQANYRARSKGKSLNTVVPQRLFEAMTNALDRFEDEHGDVDDYVVRKLGYSTPGEMFQYLGAEQIDTIALAIDQIDKNGGLVVGHQTGVGKGRIAAAILRYGQKLGKKPVFMTSKPNLFSALHQDLSDIGFEMKPLIIASDAKLASITNANGDIVQAFSKGDLEKALNTGQVPEGYDCVFAMYSQLNGAISYDGQAVPKQQRGPRAMTRAELDRILPGPNTSNLEFQKIRFVAQLAVDNIVVMDESQNGAGESNIGQFLNRLVVPYVKGITYSSATFAKRAENFQLYSRTAIGDQQNVAANLARLGTAGQEWVAMQLAIEGQMVRAEQKFDCEINFNIDTTNSDRDVERIDHITNNVRMMLELDGSHEWKTLRDQWTREVLLPGLGGKYRNAEGQLTASVTQSNFASTVHNLIAQTLFMMRTQPSIDAAVRMITGESAVGQRKPIVAVFNTMDAFVKDMIAGGVAQVGETFPSTYHDLLQKTLDGLRRVTVTDDAGKKKHFYLPMDWVKSNHFTGMLWDTIIRHRTDNVTTDLPVSPIDEMTNQLKGKGYVVGEITAREFYITKDQDGNSILKKRSLSDKNRNKVLADFNNGRCDVMIINSAGAEGLSAHSSEKFNDKWSWQEAGEIGKALPRGMVLAQFAGDINTVIQMLGRINRTGQIHKPGYEVVVSDLPAEKRPLIMLLKKLHSLSANISGNKKSGVNLPVDEVFNLYGDEAFAQMLLDNPQINDILGNPLGLDPINQTPRSAVEYRRNGDFIRQLTGRTALLPVAQQLNVWDEIKENYNGIVEHAKQTNEYTLDSQELPYNATVKDTSPLAPSNRMGYSALSEPTVIKKLEVDVLKKPFKAQEIREKIIKTLERVVQFPAPRAQTAEGRAGIEEMARARARGERSVGKYFTGEGIPVVSQKNAAVDYQRLLIRNLQKNTEKYLRDHPSFPQLRRDEILSQAAGLEELLGRLQVGNSYFFRYGSHQDAVAPAVLIDVQVKPSRTLSPSKPSLYTAIFAVNSGQQTISLQLNKMADNWRFTPISKSAKVSDFLANDHWNTIIPSNKREEVYVITGNLLNIPDPTAGQPPGSTPNPFRGRMIHFTYQDGTIESGILLNRNFDIGAVNLRVTLTADEGVYVLGRDGVLESQLAKGTRVPQVKVDRAYAGRYRMEVPANKKAGEAYFQDGKLLELVLDNEFVKRRSSNIMVAYFDDSKLRDVLERTIELGAAYQIESSVYNDYFGGGVVDVGDNSEKWGPDSTETDESAGRFFETVKSKVSRSPSFRDVLASARHDWSLREKIDPAILRLTQQVGIRLVTISGAKGIQGAFCRVNGVDVVILDRGCTSQGEVGSPYDAVLRHELLHYLERKKNPQAIKLMHELNPHSVAFMAFMEKLEANYRALGFRPLSKLQIMEEAVADFYGRMVPFSWKGKSYSLNDAFRNPERAIALRNKIDSLSAAGGMMLKAAEAPAGLTGYQSGQLQAKIGDIDDQTQADSYNNDPKWLKDNPELGQQKVGDIKAFIQEKHADDIAIFHGAEFYPEVLNNIPKRLLDRAQAAGIVVVPVKNMQGAAGLYTKIEGVPHILVNDYTGTAVNHEEVFRHELHHALVEAKDPNAVALMHNVDYQSTPFQFYKQLINEMRQSYGLAPLSADAMADEYAADFYAGLKEFSTQGHVFYMEQGFINTQAAYASAKATDAAGMTTAAKAQASVEATTGQAPKAALFGLFGSRGQQAPPPPQPTRGPYRRRAVQAYMPPLKEGWKAPFQAMQEIFAAETVSDWAKRSHSIMVKQMGLAARTMAHIESVLREYKKDFNKLTKEQFLDFLDAVESGQAIPQGMNPRLQEAANKWRVISDALHQEIFDRSGGFFNYVENYFPRLFKRPEEAQKALQALKGIMKTGASLTGPGSFKKPRSVDYLSISLTPLGEHRMIDGVLYEGLGLEPRYDNYVDMMVANAHEKLRFIMGMDMFKDWKAEGLIKYYRTNHQPTGWVEMTDKKFQVWHYDQNVKGRIKRGAYYAPFDVARIINNFLDPGLRGNPLYDAYRNPVSFVNSLRVGLSAFHAMFTLVSDLSHGVGSNLAAAFESIIHGRVGDAARDLKDLAKTFNVVGSLRNAEKIYQQYLNQVAHGELVDPVAFLAAGGMRVGATPISEMSVSFADMWSQAKTPQGWADAPRSLMEKVAWPIMGYLVPRAKLNATYRMYMKELERAQRAGKVLTQQDQIQIAQDVVQNIDNIFGQLVYDNLSLNRWMKDTLHVFVGFPGWNIGSFRTMTGAGRGVYHLGSEGIKAAIGLATGKGASYTHMDTQARMGLEKTIGMLAVVGLLGAITQTLMTGKGPEDPYDLFFPKTGNKLPNGQAERIRWPSYLRDYIGAFTHPYEMVKGKLNWPFHIFAALADNQDYAGRQVRDPEAPFFTQSKQLGKYIGTTLLPFSIQGYARARSQGAGALSLVGLTPAPKAFSNTDAANVIDRYYSVAVARTLSPKQVETFHKKMELMDLLRAGDKQQFKELSQEYIKDGQLTRNQVKEVIKQSQKPSLVSRFEKMPLDWQLKAFEAGLPSEKKAWEQSLLKRVANTQPETLIDLKDKLVPTLKEVGAYQTAAAIKTAKIPASFTESVLKKADEAVVGGAYNRSAADQFVAGAIEQKLSPEEKLTLGVGIPRLNLKETKKELMRRAFGMGG